MKNLKTFFSNVRKISTNKVFHQVSPGTEMYVYLKSEYNNRLSKSLQGNLIIPSSENIQKNHALKKKTLIAIKNFIKSSNNVTRSFVASDEYMYYISEYRQNSLSRDYDGNLLIPSEIHNQNTLKKVH